jgi:hypothetical protein
MAEAVGFPPKYAGVKGKPRGPSLWPFHYASFSFEEGDGRERLNLAFRALENRGTQIARLTEDGGRVMLCVFASPIFGWAVEMDARELALLVRCGVALGIEVYREPDSQLPLDGGETE